jgi:hypothetical protein
MTSNYALSGFLEVFRSSAWLIRPQALLLLVWASDFTPPGVMKQPFPGATKR